MDCIHSLEGLQQMGHFEQRMDCKVKVSSCTKEVAQSLGFLRQSGAVVQQQMGLERVMVASDGDDGGDCRCELHEPSLPFVFSCVVWPS